MAKYLSTAIARQVYVEAEKNIFFFQNNFLTDCRLSLILKKIKALS